MKYYTEKIPVTLAEKLKEKGMLIRYEQTDEGIRPMTMFCEVFDWLTSEKGWFIAIGREYDFAVEEVTERFEWVILKVGSFASQPDDDGGHCDTWNEAADKAIEKAIELL